MLKILWCAIIVSILFSFGSYHMIKKKGLNYCIKSGSPVWLHNGDFYSCKELLENNKVVLYVPKEYNEN